MLLLRMLVGIAFIIIGFGELERNESVVREISNTYLEGMRTLGIQCPEVVVAQIALETRYLTSKIYKENNNMFGMKESSRNWDIEGGQHGHALYVDRQHSILDYREWQIQRAKGRVFKTNEEYIYFLGHLWQNEDGSWARYATDREYEDKLRIIIKALK